MSAAADRGSRVFTIPAHLAFLDKLAAGILSEAAGDPLRLASVTVLLPTRRACRSLREAFLRLSDGKPLLLPRMLPLNDLDEEEIVLSAFGASDASIPPAIAALKRQLMLARLIASLDQNISPDQAVRLAAELARLLDQTQTERMGFERLAALVPDQYAEHWQQTLAFLGIVTEHWPPILETEGRLDPAEHRNRLFAAQIEIWNRGNAGRIIAAGSTGSIPATADLLTAIARLPEGSVVLPGLDRSLDDEAWAALDETHPQSGLKHLLDHIGIVRADVQPWPGCDDAVPPRTRLVAEAMRPASTTHQWRSLSNLGAAAVADLVKLDCPSPREEAEAIALIMREALESRERTCALVTPDRRLAARVARELARWNVDIDDSGGTPLGQTPPGAFLRLTAAMVAEAFAPVATLAVCKHPLAAAGMNTATFRALSRRAELLLLRGPKPPEGLDGLRRLITTAKTHRSDLTHWVDRLNACCADFAGAMAVESTPVSTLLAAHLAAAESLARTTDATGASRLWAGDAGEAAASFAAELAECCDTLGPIAPASYPALFDALMAGLVVRPRFGRHPRLSILGPLEARLQRFDVIVLAGLNEGTWPAEAAADPWMSRPMRQAFGLPSPEQRIALAAHDVAQALCAPRVILTRAVKVDGTPTVPSRWLRRLERAIDAAGLTDAFSQGPTPWLSWAKALSTPDHVSPIAPPAPKPAVAARPRRLSVTQIEKWMRDPYSIYARHILKLEALDPLEQDASIADYGIVVHHALQRFIERHPTGPLPNDAYAQLCVIGQERFAEEAIRPSVMAFWWPRFERIAAWFLATESARRGAIVQAFAEVKGVMTLPGPAGPFELTARADRIDRLTDRSLAIIDYKTGVTPSNKEVYAGYAPQLPLEAAMARAGGFENIAAADVDALYYWRMHGRDEGGKASAVTGDIGQVADTARAGLERLIAAFDDPATGYGARPNPEFAPTYSDYLHLARVKEWSAAGDEE